MGLARAIRPIHAPSTAMWVLSHFPQPRRPMPEAADYTVARIGALAADCLARAVARAVFEATAWPGTDILCWRSLPK
jgi:L-aminopeptidase/D-esterase-like protein